ncbi:MAG TPA: Maf family protein, partial [Lysobacter sp.]|nr:Maf family protein [Lysobacter sp.]
MNGTRLILASTSTYRRELLARLRLPFDTARPEVDERPMDGETPSALAERLAIAKAGVIARREPGAFVIGSDQVAELEGRPLGKPGGRDGAISQLGAMSGREVLFRTAVCVQRSGDAARVAIDTTTVR